MKKVVGSVLALVVVAVAGLGIWFVAEYRGARVDTVGKVDFDRPMAIPEIAGSTVEADGTRVFELDIQKGTTDLGKAQPTRTWGINGPFLGPTLRASRGEKVRIEATNSLGEPTTLHWHGMHLPAEMDGGPHQMIEAGATWEPHWEINQPAATLWYHPHLHGETASHVYNGLAGLFILDDPSESDLGLPDTYGVDDLPVMVQDKNFDDDGQFDDSHSIFSNLGVLGEEILVNGTPSPYAEVGTESVRLRLLNGSGGRTFNFTFDDARTFELIATDGGLLDAPAAMDRLQLAPGERAEIVVDFSPGRRPFSAARSWPETATASPAVTPVSTSCSCVRPRPSLLRRTCPGPLPPSIASTRQLRRRLEALSCRA
ncbi:multicopper oxidase family protein [Nocardioides alcanivorans]|uniref:multicopper oxidase family protein n=1 Tax=Nocardioides alcanivorans TaxID=2897352 RepID=UPI001F3DF842|nr:multicopper oxidase domain-containing protein [Nocardioides alcanivorans]